MTRRPSSLESLSDYFHNTLIKRHAEFENLAGEYLPDVHNQARMAFTHIARAYYSESEFTEKVEFLSGDAKFSEALRKANHVWPRRGAVRRMRARRREARCVRARSLRKEREQIAKAYGHLQRASLDSEKGIYGSRIQYVDSVMGDYAETPKNGIVVSPAKVFLGAYYDSLGTARRAYKDGKIFEALGLHDYALKEYATANQSIAEAERLVNEAEPKLHEKKKEIEIVRTKAQNSRRWAWIKLIVQCSLLLIVIAFLLVPDSLNWLVDRFWDMVGNLEEVA